MTRAGWYDYVYRKDDRKDFIVSLFDLVSIDVNQHKFLFWASSKHKDLQNWESCFILSFADGTVETSPNISTVLLILPAAG